MTAHSRAFVQFARAARTEKVKPRYYVFGTQLTAVTKLLRPGDAVAALERISAAVHDWDGGTRLSDALEELFDHRARRDRFEELFRNSFCRMGLDRGSCETMAKNVARLSRLAQPAYLDTIRCALIRI